jgi:predicted nucleotidyltransferase
MMEKYNINQTTLKILLLYASNYKKSLHLREIARETKVDVKAVQLQLKRLEKINVLSSIVKGRNKEYRLNLSNLMTKYYMMLAETFASIVYLGKNFLIKKIISEVGNHVEGAILLFGSFAKGQITKKSDIDLFFIVEKKLDRSVVSEVGNLVGREISVKSASRRQFLKGLEDGDPLIREVVSNHIVLKGVDDFCEIMWRYHARE